MNLKLMQCIGNRNHASDTSYVHSNDKTYFPLLIFTLVVHLKHLGGCPNGAIDDAGFPFNGKAGKWCNDGSSFSGT